MQNINVAIASSGLGHVSRGIETWAQDTAVALAGEGVDVTLFAAGAAEGGRWESEGGRSQGSGVRDQESGVRDQESGVRDQESGVRDQESGVRDQESGVRGQYPGLRIVVLPSLRRGDPRAVRLVARSPGFTWRWGLKSDYGWEQFSFWWHLWPHLRRGRFDILHVQDPMLAYWCRLYRKCGLLRTREILAHGTEEPAEFLRRFEFVQHLAPWHLAEARQKIGVSGQGSGVRRGFRMPEGRAWVAIANFVDTERFRPRATNGVTGDPLRSELGIPKNAFVVGTVAAVKKNHKRVDYLIREFASLESRRSANSVSPCEHSAPSFLIIAGARTSESDELVRLAEEVVPGCVRFLFDRPREQMPDIYRAMDVFVLASLFEMMPIALLEALASGVPAIVNQHPVLEWMVGTSGEQESCGGESIDMSQPGRLRNALNAVTSDWVAARGASARRQAGNFGKPAVIREYIEYYRQIGDARTRVPW